MGNIREIKGYKYVVQQEGVCGGEPTIKGTRIEPKHIAAYGTIEDTMKDFELSKDEVDEAIKFAYCGKWG